MAHTILVGADASHQDTDSARTTGFFSATTPTLANSRTTVALQDPLAIPTIFFIPGSTGYNNRSVVGTLGQWSGYAQDQIEIGRYVQLIGGIRFDRVAVAITNRFNGQRFARTDHLWSPRGAIIVKPAMNTSLYASYTRSYLPQSGDQFSSLDVTTAALAPERFDNEEVGGKWDITPRLAVTLAAYRLDRANTRAAGTLAGTTVLTGRQRSEGVEASATGRVTERWQISLGYAYTDARITSTTSAAPAGQRVAQVPRHQFSLWTRYQVTPGLGLGLGVYRQSGSFATISDAVTLPGYTRVDMAAFVRVTPHLEGQINVENLAGTTYFPVASSDNNIATGAPRSVRFTLKARL